MLVDKGRRALLARLVDMPLTVAGIELAQLDRIDAPVKKKIDMKEYANTLELCCDTWQQGTTCKVAKQIKTNARYLEPVALYAPSKEREEAISLLCGYKLLVADLDAEQTPSAAVPTFSV